VPAGVDAAEAAAVILSWTTAYQLLHRANSLKCYICVLPGAETEDYVRATLAGPSSGQADSSCVTARSDGPSSAVTSAAPGFDGIFFVR
jgi:hypothetical protein